MRTIATATAGLLFVARAAHGNCVFYNDYYEPELRGACTAEASVPEGCPVHVATPFGDVPKFEVYRGEQVVTVTSTMAVVDTLTVPMRRIDVYSCSCESVDGEASFDRHQITVTGARDGDLVVFDPGKSDAHPVIAIGPAGPCPAPAWPTQYIIATRCDLCSGDTDTPNDDDRGGGGCATSGGGGLLLVLLAGLAMLGPSRTRSG